MLTMNQWVYDGFVGIPTKNWVSFDSLYYESNLSWAKSGEDGLKKGISTKKEMEALGKSRRCWHGSQDRTA
ncbi:MAG: hypothetical protein IPO48_20045 [Saprospiraceae bacterium]|nr:hypothetical protein [Saprospiraceae bacterium]